MGELIKSVSTSTGTSTSTDMVPSFITGGGATGFEKLDNDCISIPFLRLAQVNTPQVQPGNDQIKNLQAGMYFNPSTGRIYGSEPKFIILGFSRSWNVWFGEPPAARFVKSMTNEDFELHARSRTKTENNKTTDPEGNRYQDTRNFFLLSADHPEDGILLYPMTSTGIPMSKKWLAKASAIRGKAADGSLSQAPMWSRVWGFKVNFVKGDKGSYYQVADASDLGWIPAEFASIAKSAFEEVREYDKARVSGIEKHDDAPDWVNEK